MPIVPSSALTKFIQSLDDKTVIKANQLPNRLAKHVKPEELEFSGVAERISNLDPKSSVTKQDLLDWDANRADKWGEKHLTSEKNETTYHGTTLADSDEDSYFENLRTFDERNEDTDILGNIMDSFSNESPRSNPGSQGRQVKSHFSSTTPNYASHSRGSIESIGGKQTRLIQEIQSDLHQNAIGAGGYQGDEVIDYNVGAMDPLGHVNQDAVVIKNREGSTYLGSGGALRRHEGGGQVSYPFRTFNNKSQAEAHLKKLQEDHPGIEFVADVKKLPLTGGPPNTPLKKNWARKEIEKEILHAVDEGQEAIAIPLEGARGEMARSEGVQRWYETQVRSTLKKITKQIPGAKYQEISGAGSGFPPNTTREQFFEEGLVNESIDHEEVYTALRNADIIDRDVGASYFTPEELAELVPELGDDVQRRLAGIPTDTQDGLIYGQIVLPPSEKIPGKQTDRLLFSKLRTAIESDVALQNDITEGIIKSEAEMGEGVSANINDILEGIIDDDPVYTLNLSDNSLAKIKSLYEVGPSSWPELTPEVREVFKRWETPPKDLAELNKLQSELPNRVNQSIQYVASNSALQARFGDLEEFKIAINKVTDQYKSVFESPDLYAVIDDLSGPDMHKLTGQLQKDVDEAIAIIDNPDIVIDFVKKHWDTIAKEQKYPLEKTKITPATYRYPEWTKKFELYSAGALGLTAAASPDDARAQEQAQREDDPVGSLLREGVDLEELSLAIQEKNGMTPEEARDAIHMSMQANIDQIKGQEEPELIEAAMQEKYGDYIADANFDYGGDFPEESLANEPQYELVPVADVREYANKTDDELYAANENFNFVHSELINLIKGVAFEDEDAMLKFNRYSKDLNYHIANNLRKMGRNVEVDDTNQIVVVNENGTTEPLSDGFWSDLGEALAAGKFEIGTGISGAVAAGMAAKRTLPYMGLPGKLASLGILSAEMAGGIAGTITGRGADMAYNAYTEKEDVELEFYTKQLMEAGMFDFVAGATIGVTLKVAKETIVGVGRALKYLASGTPNREGAYNALKQYTNLSDEEIEELVVKYEQATGTTIPGGKEVKGMTVVPQIQPDAEGLVNTASKYSPTLTTDIARTIDTRAKDVINLAQESSPDNIGIVLKDALEGYKKEVKGYYTGIKQKAIRKVDPTYQFNFDKTAVKPFLQDIESRITNPAIQRRVQLYLNRVEQIGELRGFKDLLDLRSTMNDFKYNTRIRSAVDYDSINKVIGKIDKEIETAVSTMPEGDKWLKEWKMANTEYSNMLRTQKNALYKVLNRPGISEKVVVQSLSKYINSMDGTFMQVVSKLPVRKRKMVEGAVLEHLVDKHVIGDPQGMQAINFPALSEELKSIGFTSTKARNLKRGVNMLADVFKNDHKLSKLSNTIHTEKAAQGLTTDLVAKAHYSLMAKIWSKMQSIIPFNNNAEFVALGLNIEKVLRNPQNAKAVEDLIKMFPKDEEIESGVRQLALVAAEFGQRENYPYVKLHKIGGDRKVRNGKYGKGIYYSTDEGGIKGRAAPNKLKTSSKEVLPEMIATEADIKAILNVEEVTPEMIKASPDLQEKLLNRGYQGFAIGHDVIILPE